MNTESSAELNPIIGTIIFPKLWKNTEQPFKYRGHDFYAQLVLEHESEGMWFSQLKLSIVSNNYSGIQMVIFLNDEYSTLFDPAILQDDHVKLRMKTSLDALILQNEAYERENPRPPVVEYKEPTPEEIEASHSKKLHRALDVLEKMAANKKTSAFDQLALSAFLAKYEKITDV